MVPDMHPETLHKQLHLVGNMSMLESHIEDWIVELAKLASIKIRLKAKKSIATRDERFLPS